MPIKSVEVKVQARVPLVELGGGPPGPQGISITGAVVNGSGHLILTLSNGNTIDSGYVIGPAGPIASITETGNGINIDLSSPTNPVLSLDATLEAIANFATGANRVMVWSGTDTLTTFTVDIDGTLAANSDTRFATQKAVKTYVDGLIAAQDAMVFKGVIDASTNPNYPAADRGHTYRISVAGKIGGASGVNVEAGDLIICLTDGTAAGTQAAVGANWTISQTNLDGAVIGPSSATDAAVAGFSGTTGKLIKVLTATEIRTAAVLATSDTPQFAGLNIGHASDTTVTRHAAGVIAVEGVAILNASGQQTVNDKDLVDSTTDIIGNADATKRSGFANDLITSGQRRVMTIPDRSGVILTDPLAATDVLPTLDLRFTDIEGAPFDDFFVRFGAGGYRQNAKGIYVPTVDREPVIDFSAGTALGTGFYGAYSNLALWSEDFSQGAWLKTNATVTVNAVTAPDGNATADKIVPTVTNGQHVLAQICTLGTVACTASVFLKAGELTKARISMSDNVSAVVRADIDLIAGTMSAAVAPAGHWTNLSTQITTLPNGWYLASITGTPDQGASKNIEVYALDASGNVSFAGNASDGLYAWGAQLTATAFLVPYVPTTSATVARSADSMVISGSDFTDFYNQTEGSVYIEYSGLTAGVSSHLLNIHRGSGAYGPRIQIAGTGGVSMSVVDNSSTVVAGGLGAGGVSGRFACSFKTDSFNAAANGVSATPDTLGNMPTGLTVFDIGKSPPGEISANARIKRITYWPKALSAAQLERMTA